MKINRCAFSLVLAAGVAMAALGAAGAQAQEVYWSVGLSSPDVQLGFSNAPQVVVQPRYQPVYQVQPVYPQSYQPYYQPTYQPSYQPVYRQPRPVYVAPRPAVYLRPAPVYMAPVQYVQPDWRYPGQRRGWRHWQERHESDRPDYEHQGPRH